MLLKPSKRSTSQADQRVILLPPTPRHGPAFCRLLGAAGVDCFVCDSFDELAKATAHGAAAILLPDSAVAADTSLVLSQILEQQPVWSDLPVLVLTRAGRPTRGAELAIATLGNVSLIEQPVRGSTLMSVIRSAIRARQRQYQVRDHLAEKLRLAELQRDREAAYRRAVEVADLGQWEVDLLSERVERSPRMDAIFGRPTSHGPWTLADALTCVHPDDRGHLQDSFRLAQRSAAEWHAEFRVQWEDGTIRWVWARGGPRFDERGRTIKFDGLLGDITERKRLIELEQAAHAQADLMRQAAESANRAKDHFLAVLSHELRTPLSPVLMGITLLEADPAVTPRMRDMLAMMRRNIAVETQLIDDMLDVSRITSNKLRLKLQPVKINDLLRYVCETCDADAQSKHLRVRCDLWAELDVVLGDSARLQQVFWNLLRNAIKFTPAGRGICVRSSNPSPQRVRVTVADEGIGIAANLLPKIFSAFDQGDPTVTREFGGLGLGLAISKAVIDMHGGTIRGDSAGKDQGATFTLELDVRAAPAAASSPETTSAVPASAGHANGSPTNILLVEDHADTARMLQEFFHSRGHAVTLAGSVAEALAAASRQAFDLVVSDIGLPDATGYDLMTQVNKRHGVPGIALSGHGMAADIARSREAGFIDHLIKPVDLEKLEQSVRSAVRANAEG